MYAGAHWALEHPAWTLRRSHASCQMVATEGGPRFSERLVNSCLTLGIKVSNMHEKFPANP